MKMMDVFSTGVVHVVEELSTWQSESTKNTKTGLYLKNWTGEAAAGTTDGEWKSRQ